MAYVPSLTCLLGWVFDGGRTVWTSGFSVMVHRDPLSAHDLERVVSILSKHLADELSGVMSVDFSSRSTPGVAFILELSPVLIESKVRTFMFTSMGTNSGVLAHHSHNDAGSGKFTYWIKTVERLSPTLTLFRHECSHPSVEHGLRQIHILWDSQSESSTSWWDAGKRERIEDPLKRGKVGEAAVKETAARIVATDVPLSLAEAHQISRSKPKSKSAHRKVFVDAKGVPPA